MADNPTTITASQIADLAGVTPSAVSNWRRRFPDFPKPISSAPGGRDLFSLPAIESWLAENDKLDPASAQKRVLWNAGHLLRSEVGGAQITEVLCAAVALSAVKRDKNDPADATLSVKQLAAVLAVRDPKLSTVFAPLFELEDSLAQGVLDSMATVDRDELQNVFEAVLATRRDRSVTSQSGEAVVDLMRAVIRERPEIVFDPAAGEGGFLLAAAEQFSDTPPALFGQELSASAWRIACQRFLVHRIDAEIALGDSLQEDAFPDLRADVILCDPPYGQRIDWLSRTGTDPRWVAGGPASKNADLVWVQHVLTHLAAHGRGFVLLPFGSLSRGGPEADVRRELVRLGAVRAIVGLGPGMARHTTLPLALWVLRAPGAVPDASTRVLIVDVESNATAAEDVSVSIEARVADLLSRWDSDEDIAPADQDIAAAIPIIELLGANTSLEPPRWVRVGLSTAEAEMRRATLEQAFDQLATERARYEDFRQRLSEVMEGVGGHTWTSVDDLVRSGRAEVIKGVRVGKDDYRGEGVRVLRTRDVQEGIETAGEPSRVDLDAMRRRPMLTLPGDIVVSPASGRLRAIVDEHGGHALAQPLSGLRLTDPNANRYVIAAFLESPRNRRFATGTAYARVNVRELELPVLMPEENERLLSVLTALARYSALATEVRDAANAMTEVVVELPGSATRRDRAERVGGE